MAKRGELYCGIIVEVDGGVDREITSLNQEPLRALFKIGATLLAWHIALLRSCINKEEDLDTTIGHLVSGGSYCGKPEDSRSEQSDLSLFDKYDRVSLDARMQKAVDQILIASKKISFVQRLARISRRLSSNSNLIAQQNLGRITFPTPVSSR